MQGCIFCKIVAGEIPSIIVYQDEDIVAFRDNLPQAPQHILFVPKRHMVSMADLTREDGPLLARIHTAAVEVAQNLGMKQGYRFLTNVGPDAGQSVPHLHFHLMGGRQLGWPPG
jgi:histidine triad (HIT) family protein